MALFLIMAVDHVHPDPVKDLRGSYKRGDLVDVYEDTQHDGDVVANPIAAPFLLIRVTDVTVSQARQYIKPAMDNGQTTQRRLYRLRIDNLPGNVRNQLTNTRYWSTTWAEVRSFIRNKVTNQDGG